ncbi:mitogen-activated protein kinase kinase kinase 7-like [Senna tora]|uniref:Mitogen-activated protein kinase kinase kinase 7-like n=1 Tax=Senna tora TaxID=362788 RepID=A0A835CJA5_9FABA|nr:mitogen-activated protein kinase kinase kinase 7-like [Senna tora]
MEQFRQLGEALGGLKALMVFRENIQFNQRQCCLLLDVFTFVYGLIAEEITQNLIFVEKHTKWKVLEQPLKEIHKIFKEGESYIKQCLESETKDWWAKAITLYNNNDCVEFYIHNLLSCIPIVIEAIESAGEISGWDQEDMQRKRLINSNKYRKEYRDLSLFQWKFGKQYLISQDFCNRYNTVWKEDKWFLLNKIREKKLVVSTKYEDRLTDILLRSLERSLERSESFGGELLPSSILVGCKDYQVRRRLGNGSMYKEIIWLGESFVVKHFFGNIEALEPEIMSLISLSHPNIMECLCAFSDEEKKECFLLMDLMTRNLCTHIEEICVPRKKIPFALPMAVDVMLQIARGMEYLHSKKIYHGELNPSNILVKPRGTSTEGYLYAKLSGFGLFGSTALKQKGTSNQNETLPFIWYAPEVLEEQEQTGDNMNSKYTEKSDVYSFGMVCFELLTGKVPFEDNHLQGDKMSRNIRAGERPLFTYSSPKYVTNLTKKCWHADPNQRPSFSSICRILRYIKRFITMNPDYNNMLDPPMPSVDYCDIESTLLRKFPSWGSSDASPIFYIPFQMFAYRVNEKEKVLSSNYNSESGSEASTYGDELVTSGEELNPLINDKKSLLRPDDITLNRRNTMPRRFSDSKANRHPDICYVFINVGSSKVRSVRPPQMSPSGRSINSETSLRTPSPRMRRTSSGHVSNSELS